jgi:hypothetical protein
LKEATQMHPTTAALFAAMFLLISHLDGSVEAYLDPGSGSIVLQFVIGGAIAALVAARSYWDRLKAFLHRGAADEDAARGGN